MKLGDLIKYLRESLGYSQKQLAERAGISRSVLSQYENNLVDPTAYVVKKLAVALEVSTDYLLGLEDDFGGRVGQKEAPQLTAEERKLLEDYNSLNPACQKLIKDTLATLLNSSNGMVKDRKKV